MYSAMRWLSLRLPVLVLGMLLLDRCESKCGMLVRKLTLLNTVSLFSMKPTTLFRGLSMPRLMSPVLAVKVNVPVVMTLVCRLANGVGLTFMMTLLTLVGARLVLLIVCVTPIRSPLIRACELALITGLCFITLIAELNEALTINA